MTAVAYIRLAEIATVIWPVGLDWLSGDEQARLARMSTERRRQQFLAARWTLRQLLAGQCGGQAEDWRLSSGEAAAPQVEAGPATSWPCLAISHSRQWLAVALADTPIGLDLEQHDRPRDYRRLLQQVACQQEQARFAQLADADLPLAFHCLWTLKEAWFKQRNEGIGGFGRLQMLWTRQDQVQPNARIWQDEQLTLALCGSITDCQLQGWLPMLQQPWRVAADGAMHRSGAAQSDALN